MYYSILSTYLIYLISYNIVRVFDKPILMETLQIPKNRIFISLRFN